MTSKAKNWSKNCSAASILSSQFQDFNDSKGKHGIDPKTTEPNTLLTLYHSLPKIFSDYSEPNFPKKLRQHCS